MAQTPWGEIEIADAHVHFFSPAFFAAVENEKGSPDVAVQLGFDRPETPEDLANRWGLELDRHRVAKAMLIASIPNDTASIGAALALPNRIASAASTWPTPPLRRPITDSRLRSVQTAFVVSFCFPSMHRYSLHDRHLRSLIEVISGYPGMFIYVHCGALSVGFTQETRSALPL